MPRIRSLKPEFPQSESIGRLSRDARLLFLQLWTVVDDSGRTRAASRMLASLLYPYDDDAPSLIGGWMDELEHENCIRRYEVAGSQYLEVVNWLKHQKIDRPTPSKLPQFSEGSSKPREPSRALDADLGPRIKDQDLGEDQKEGKVEISEIAEAVRLFNAAAARAGWPQTRHLAKQRKAACRQRLREVGVHGWKAALAKAETTPFLCGENDRGWKITFDWFCKSANFTKVLEGSYDRSARQTNGHHRPSAAESIFRAVADQFGPGTGLDERPPDPDDGLRHDRNPTGNGSEPSLDLPPENYRRS